jgi:histone H1/5
VLPSPQAAIAALHERNGSSPAAIKKYIEANNTDITFAPHSLRDALKKGVANGHLVKVKASYKLAKPGDSKAAPASATKKAVPKKAAAGAKSKTPVKAKVRRKNFSKGRRYAVLCAAAACASAAFHSSIVLGRADS